MKKKRATSKAVLFILPWSNCECYGVDFRIHEGDQKDK